MKPRKMSVVPETNDIPSILDAAAEFTRRVCEAHRVSAMRKALIAVRPGMKHKAFPRPVAQDSLGVHPKQRDEAIKFCKDRGVPTDYTPGGRPIITSAHHQKAHAKIRGFRPMRGY